MTTDFIKVKITAQDIEFMIANFKILPKVFHQIVYMRAFFDLVLDGEIDPRTFLNFSKTLNISGLSSQINQINVDLGGRVFRRFLDSENYNSYKRELFDIMSFVINGIKRGDKALSLEKTIDNLIETVYDEKGVRELLNLLISQSTSLLP